MCFINRCCHFVKCTIFYNIELMRLWPLVNSSGAFIFHVLENNCFGIPKDTHLPFYIMYFLNMLSDFFTDYCYNYEYEKDSKRTKKFGTDTFLYCSFSSCCDIQFALSTLSAYDLSDYSFLGNLIQLFFTAFDVITLINN